MSKKVIVLLSLLISVTAFYSCEECIKCEIIGNSVDSQLLTDTNNVYYDEFCGSPSEADAFREDVKYAAESRSCKIYSIRKIATGEVLISMVYCGGKQQLDQFEYGLDSLLYTTYQDQDAEWVIDTLITNPAAWKCD